MRKPLMFPWFTHRQGCGIVALAGLVLLVEVRKTLTTKLHLTV